MQKFNFKKRNFISGPHLIAPILIGAGLLVLISPMLFENPTPMEKVLSVGFGSILLGLLIVFSFDGTEINFTLNRYKEYISIGGFKFGKWEMLPDIITVKIIAINSIQNTTPNGISPSIGWKETNFKIILYSKAPKPLFSFTYLKKYEATKNAKWIASNLRANLVIGISNSSD